MMDKGVKTACGQIQSRHSDGQVETSWPSASRIETERPANGFDPGPMRMAANDDVDTARARIELQCFDVVKDVDAAPTERYHLGLRIMLRPVAGIDVPSDRSDRRDPLEAADNVWRTDIAGVDDMTPILTTRQYPSLPDRMDKDFGPIPLASTIPDAVLG
jgi:hypothetical protein